MFLLVALVAIPLFSSSDSTVTKVRPTPSRNDSVVKPFDLRTSNVDCGKGNFFLNTIPWMNFSANVKIGKKDQIECRGCGKSGMPTWVNCSNSNTWKSDYPSWSCKADFPNKDNEYEVTSPSVDCERDYSKDGGCMKNDTCRLEFWAEIPFSIGLPPWFYALLAVLIVFVIVVTVFSIIAMQRRRARLTAYMRDLLESRVLHVHVEDRVTVVLNEATPGGDAAEHDRPPTYDDSCNSKAPVGDSVQP